jgi:hypothetical protein
LQDEGVRDLGYDHARRTLVSSKRRMVDEEKGRAGKESEVMGMGLPSSVERQEERVFVSL